MACLQEQDEIEREGIHSPLQEFHFPTMDAALHWLDEHMAEVALGGVVVVGSVIAAPSFVAIVGGALVLAHL